MKKYFWCNYNNDVIEIVVENPDDYGLVVDELNEHRPIGIIEESSDQLKVHIVVKSCSCDDDETVERQISSVNMLHIYPSVLERGWEYHRILFFRHEDFEELMQRLKENSFTVEILRKVPFDGLISGSLAFTADALLSDLTEKQVDAILTAHRYGYYSLPRRADVQTIASKINVPRTTFQEHLKKAENKLISALAPYVQLFKHSSQDQRKKLKIDTIARQIEF